MVVVALFLAACSRFALDKRWREERYLLIAIDSESQTALVLDADGAPTLVGPTVFSIGANERYIVVKQHPATDQWAAHFDRSVTNYFVVERSSSTDFRERAKGVHGPLSKGEYDKLAASAALPSFTKTFDELK
jgi:hypothetical protein